LTRRWIFALSLVEGCLAVPPAVDPKATAPAEDPPSTAVPIPIPAQDPGKALVECPLVTGKNQLCTDGLSCTRDENGCEKCTCREDLENNGRTREPSPGMDPRDRELE
jgi:hypothetical protein